MNPRIYVTLDAPLLSEVVVDDVGWLPMVATVVIRHSSGMVGFDLASKDIVEAFLGDSVFIERRNCPRWHVAKPSTLSPSSARHFPGGFYCCARPGPKLVSHLQEADRAQRLLSQNKILARHGRPQLPYQPTIFETWHEELRVRTSVVQFMIAESQMTALWSSNEYGAYARFLGHDGPSLLASVERLCGTAALPFNIVESQKALPAW